MSNFSNNFFLAPAEAKKPLVIIAGPTATGKTAVSVELAARLNGSIISADSMQVYRGMDIGSAKVTEEEKRGIPHYLIDVADPEDSWNVVRFQKEAVNAVDAILAEGRLPFLVGGTGFYIQALLYGIDFTQMEADSDDRASMEEAARRDGPQALHRRLQEIDPEAAEAIHPNNVKRIIRALEFAQNSGGLKISEHNRRERMREPAFNAVFFVLTMDRKKLYERIDARVDLMMQKGLADEVRRLRAGGLTASDVSMQRDSRHFAKRQLTWFRREKNVIWIDADSFADRQKMSDTMEEMIRTRLHLPQEKV